MFRIRKKIFPERGYQYCQKKYESFLEKNRVFFLKRFFKMFQQDYFHDGIVRIRKFDFRNSELHIDIDCPNFMDKDNRYVDVDFSLHFLRVLSFSLTPELTLKRDIIFQNSIFLHCEIGTLIDPYIAQSIIIQCLSEDNHIFYIASIFKKFELRPKDPLLYKRLKSNKKIHLEEWRWTNE